MLLLLLLVRMLLCFWRWYFAPDSAIFKTWWSRTWKDRQQRFEKCLLKILWPSWKKCLWKDNCLGPFHIINFRGYIFHLFVLLVDQRLSIWFLLVLIFFLTNIIMWNLGSLDNHLRLWVNSIWICLSIFTEYLVCFNTCLSHIF